MSIHSELKPDRNLLNYNFDGYKLSLEPPQTVRHQLKSSIERILVDPNNYSFLHAKIFGLHNFLFGETSDEYENVYFVDRNRKLLKTSMNPFTSQLDLCSVWTVPFLDVSDSERYNISLKFVTKNRAILNNGSGTLFVLNTGDRGTDMQWELIHSMELEYKNCYIQDALLKDNDLHVILCKIEHENKKAHLAISWITIKNNSWEFVSSKELVAKGDVTYIQLEKTCEAIYVTSSLGCKFVRDSENAVVEIENVESGEGEGYKWSQDPENVVIHFILPEDVKKEDIKVESGNRSIKVEYKESRLLEGELFGRVDSDFTAFTLSKNLLEIIFMKAEQNEAWPCLLSKEIGKPNEPNTETAGDQLEQMTSEKEEDPPQGITFNTEQVEECDFSDAVLTTFERICSKTHKTTHRYNFGSNGILLTTHTDAKLPLSLGIRSDVDVCIYEPRVNGTNFELKHVKTLLAFGYIQASKQQKKFLACPPDASYSIVCKTNRHLFLYRQTKSVTSGELKNRRTGARIGTVAEQQVISLPNEEIYGVYASVNSIYLLGEEFLIHLKI